MARGKKSEFAPLNLDPAQYQDAIQNGDIKIVTVKVTVDKTKGADGKSVPVKKEVQALHAATDAGVALLLNESGHFRRAANRYIDAEYAARTRKANQPFEKKFADSISALMTAKNLTREAAIEKLRAVLE